MKNSFFFNRALVFILFFLLIFISIYLNQPSFPCDLNFNDNIYDLIKKCGENADYSQYAKLSLDYYNLGHASENNKWIERNWPLGATLIHLTSLVVFGESGKVMFIPVFLNVFFWSFFFYYLTDLFWSRNKIYNFLIILLIFFLFNSYLFKNFLFTYGTIETNGWGSLFFTLGIILLYKKIINENVRKKNFNNFFLASFAFFISTLFRVNLDLLIYLILIFLILKILITHIVIIFYKKKFIKFSFKFFKFDYLVLKIFFLAFLLSLPLKIYNKSIFNAKSSPAAHVNWMPSKVLYEHGGGYAVEGGGNLGCILNPKLCEKLSSIQLEQDKKNDNGDGRVYFNHYWDQKFYMTLTISEFLNQPLNWMYNKWIKIFPKFWFNSGLAAGATGDYNIYDKFLDFIILIMLFYLIYKSFISKLVNLSLIVIPVLISYLLIFNFYIMEPRYFIPLKLIILILFILVLDTSVKQIVKKNKI